MTTWRTLAPSCCFMPQCEHAAETARNLLTVQLKDLTLQASLPSLSQLHNLVLSNTPIDSLQLFPSLAQSFPQLHNLTLTELTFRQPGDGECWDNCYYDQLEASVSSLANLPAGCSLHFVNCTTYYLTHLGNGWGNGSKKAEMLAVLARITSIDCTEDYSEEWENVVQQFPLPRLQSLVCGEDQVQMSLDGLARLLNQSPLTYLELDEVMARVGQGDVLSAAPEAAGPGAPRLQLKARSLTVECLAQLPWSYIANVQASCLRIDGCSGMLSVQDVQGAMARAVGKLSYSEVHLDCWRDFPSEQHVHLPSILRLAAHGCPVFEVVSAQYLDTEGAEDVGQAIGAHIKSLHLRYCFYRAEEPDSFEVRQALQALLPHCQALGRLQVQFEGNGAGMQHMSAEWLCSVVSQQFPGSQTIEVKLPEEMLGSQVHGSVEQVLSQLREKHARLVISL